ncbi:unnamed protein product [Polarella glacialis]|uniref:ATP-dependent RNA helicase n=2 Tax=Polarella glacialis TaxID=89957 RepID=A0A813KE77_POLGL|nr:unnamed protein product [Polarella glacialis]
MAKGAKNVAKSRKGGKGGKDGKGSAQGRNRRNDSRNDEEKEIKALEARIRAEAPRSGTGAFGLKDSNAKGSDPGQGPALTAQLFKDLPLSKRTSAGLEASGFTKMTQIQRGAIPHALCGRDILGEARTGSGKTLAFLVPLMDCLFRNRWTQMDGLGALVVSPTRELAYQIFQVLSNVGAEHELSAGCIVGGRSLEEEQGAVASMSVLVATPGRLLQHLDESPGFDASALKMLVIDEADRIMDFGFQESMHNILEHLPKERQTLLFSATLHSSVARLSRAALRSPEVVSVHREGKSRTPDKLKQIYMSVPLDKKVDLLFSFLRSHSQKKIIVFVSTCKQVRFFYEAFKKLKPGPAVLELHGRQSLTKRLVVFNDFTERERAAALFCTDIAARGVDFPAVDWVVQMDCPDSVDSYIHRVGRTARYQSSGNSALFLLPSENAFADKLAAAKIEIRSIAAKQQKLVSIGQQLASVHAGAPDVRHLAQRSYCSYLRSVMLMKDKDVFDVKVLPKEEFASSLGLVDVPDLGALLEADGEDADQNPSKKRKNQSALQRLKDRIKAKKQAAKSGDGGRDEEAAEEEEDLKRDGTKTKIGRWERRQKRIAAANASVAAGRLLPAPTVEEDDLLQMVEAQPGELGEAEATAARSALATRKKRMKLKRDGTAVGADGKHTFFSGKEGLEAASELAQLAEELGASRGSSASRSSGDRSSFLARVSQDLASRDSSDAAVSRARIHERHQNQKRQDRKEAAKGRDSGDEEDFGATGSRSPSPAQSRSASPPARRPQQPKQRLVAEKAVAETRRDLPDRRPPAPTPKAVLGPGASVDELERQALSMLSGGLFA